MNASSISVGQKIELNDGRIAHVRFVGTTNFQTGDWIGVELEEATGKNDGSVKGERYFDCEQGHGMFLRPAGVKSVVELAPKEQNKVGNGTGATARSRPSSVHAGLNGVKKTDTGLSRRASTIAASPTPGARGSRLSGIRSPVKSPTKQLGVNNISSTSSSRTATPPAAAGRRPGVGSTAAAKARPSLAGGTAATKRSSITPAAPTTGSSRTARPSFGPSTTASRQPAGRPFLGRDALRSVPPQNRSATRQPSGQELKEEDEDAYSATEDSSRQPSNSALSPSESESAPEEPSKLNFAPPPLPPIPPDPGPRANLSRRGSSPPASLHSQRTVRSTAVSSRHVEELEAKIRLLERKRLEDRDIKRTLEQAQQERDRYQGIIEKLQNKYQPQQQELTSLKKALAQAESRFAEVETLQAESESIMEMATLDKEMAEETAESLKMELDSLRARQEEMELELEVLRDENTEFSKEMSPEERTSAGWLQLEKENDRLRNALLRLRDLTQDREEELRGDVAELRSQVKDLDAYKGQYDDTNEKLLTSEAIAEDLRQQLEAALGAEDMIEELSDRNMSLQERMDEFRATIDDLENLKELNDELEVNHIEAEKQMQEEIDFKDALIFDRDRNAKQQQAALDDADYTISRFRELVAQLQTDLEDMQASKQLSDTESADLESRSRAMIDLNMRLQSSAAKTQIKTIDLELRKLEAQEASEHLAIVQLFLPEAFHAERDSVLALLRFKRISFKATLLHSFIRERVASFGARGRDENVFAAIDVLNSLIWISGMAERFIGSICTCSMEDFAQYESALYELEPVERALNGYVDALRRDDVKESVMADELHRSVAVMSHLASIHVREDLASHADELIMRTQYLQSQLEGTASALGVMRTMFESKVPTEAGADDVEESVSEIGLLINRAEALTTHARGAKVMVGKTHRALTDLQERSLTLDVECADNLNSTELVAREVVSYIRSLGEGLQGLFEEEGRLDPIGVAEVTSVIASVATSTFALPTPEAGPFTTLAGRLRTLSDLLADLAALPTDLDNTVEFERAPAPWVARATELKQHKLTARDTEAELARATESLRERDAVVKVKEMELEEQSVRIEMLEARMREASKRSARIAELERIVHETKDGERRARHDLDRARRDAQHEIERVRVELGRVAERSQRSGATAELEGGAMGIGAKMTMKRLEHSIASLQAAVRFLKEENQRLRIPSANGPRQITKSLDWLHEPILKAKNDRERENEALQKEGKDILRSLLQMATSPNIVDLTTLPENKLAWRPSKDSSRWQIEKKKEEWEDWRDWLGDVTADAGRTKSKGYRAADADAAVATTPGTNGVGKVDVAGEVKIVRPLSVELPEPTIVA